MNGFTQLLALAVLSEQVTNFIKDLLPRDWRSGDKRARVNRLVCLGVSTLLAYATGVNIIDILELPSNFDGPLGSLVTGVVASRGSGAVHDVLSKLEKPVQLENSPPSS